MPAAAYVTKTAPTLLQQMEDLRVRAMAALDTLPAHITERELLKAWWRTQPPEKSEAFFRTTMAAHLYFNGVDMPHDDDLQLRLKVEAMTVCHAISKATIVAITNEIIAAANRGEVIK